MLSLKQVLVVSEFLAPRVSSAERIKVEVQVSRADMIFVVNEPLKRGRSVLESDRLSAVEEPYLDAPGVATLLVGHHTNAAHHYAGVLQVKREDSNTKVPLEEVAALEDVEEAAGLMAAVLPSRLNLPT